MKFAAGWARASVASAMSSSSDASASQAVIGTPARPTTTCPLCGADAVDIYCDACEAREVALYLANNSMTDDRGVQRGDDPRR